MTELKEIFESLRVMESGTKLIGNSKLLHHMLPNLIMPIDRTHTLRFFNKNIIGPEHDLFFEIFEHCRLISKSASCESIALGGFNTSIPKIVDNAIMGYVMKNLLAGSGFKPEPES